jgi:nitrogen fixation/metabolism regulation signal transduction histidine kinase
VSLRARLVTYLTVVHLLFAGAAALVLVAHPYALFAVELAFGVSLGVGVHLARRALRTLSLGADAVRLIREEEFTSRLRETGDTEVDALIGVYNRMVDSLRAERVRVREQHHFFSQVIGASPAGIVILDFDGRIAEINPAAAGLLGVSVASARGVSLTDLPGALAKHLAALPAGSRDVAALTGPSRIRCEHGTFIDRGFTRGFFVLEELTAELRQFERHAYEKLIRVMSHEVNNTATSANSLLHSVLAYMGELPPGSRQDAEHAIRIVIDRSEALSDFMRRFADVFRLPAPVRHPAVLQDVVRPLVRLMEARPESAGVTWSWGGPDRPVVVEIDRTQFEQAVLNVLKNAAEAAGPRGVVTVRLGDEAGRVVLVVEDSGPGLTAEVQENLFTPFFSTKPDGQGIGLTLVREILAAHGFDYQLRHAGGGPTAFTIAFGRRAG